MSTNDHQAYILHMAQGNAGGTTEMGLDGWGLLSGWFLKLHRLKEHEEGFP